MASTFVAQVNLSIVPMEMVAFEDSSQIAKGLDTVIDKVVGESTTISDYNGRFYNSARMVTGTYQTISEWLGVGGSIYLLYLKNSGSFVIHVASGTNSDEISTMQPGDLFLMTQSAENIGTGDLKVKYSNLTEGGNSTIEVLLLYKE